MVSYSHYILHYRYDRSLHEHLTYVHARRWWNVWHRSRLNWKSGFKTHNIFSSIQYSYDLYELIHFWDTWKKVNNFHFFFPYRYSFGSISLYSPKLQFTYSCKDYNWHYNVCFIGSSLNCWLHIKEDKRKRYCFIRSRNHSWRSHSYGGSIQLYQGYELYWCVCSGLNHNIWFRLFPFVCC